MAYNLIGWYSKFFRDSGLGDTNPGGSRKVLLKQDMIAFTYKVKQKFFEEGSTKIWRLKDGVERNYASIYRAFKNSYTAFWDLDWNLEDLNWLEIESIDNKELYFTLDTNITNNKFKIYLENGKEVCQQISEDEKAKS